MEQEREDNFRWALEKLKGLFIKEDLFPKVILTDRDNALMNAIAVVFPHTVNMLCRFHIEKNVSSHCKKNLPSDMVDAVMEFWRKLVWSRDEEKYQEQLNEFEQACVEWSTFVNYVKETWLKPHKDRFVEAWVNQVMHLGNLTTNR
jgi:transposase-like protein